MSDFEETLIPVCYAYQEHYVPYRGRKVRTRWRAGRATASVRSISKSQVEPVFRITCHQFRKHWTTEIFRFENQLWWPISVGPLLPNKERFFRALEKGHEDILDVLEPLGVGLPCQRRDLAAEPDPEMGGRVLRSTEREMEARAQTVGTNLIIVDDRLAMRGGEPLLIGHESSTRLDRRTAKIVNSGIEFGKLVLAEPFPPFHRDEPDQAQLQAAAANGYVFSLSTCAEEEHPESRSAPSIWNVEILSEIPLQVDPIDFQVKAGLRLLASEIERAINQGKLPQELAENVSFFTDIEPYATASIAECAKGLEYFAGWCEQLPPRDRPFLAEQHSWVRWLIASVVRRCRMERRPSPFDCEKFEAIDEEAIAGLGL